MIFIKKIFWLFFMKRIVLRESGFRLIKKLIFEDYKHMDEVLGIPSIFDFLKMYDKNWVIKQFLSGSEKEKWFPRIKANDYKSALYDLQKYGEFRYFNKSKVFTMLARVMANTAILYANSAILQEYEKKEYIPFYTKLVRRLGKNYEKDAILKRQEYGSFNPILIYSPLKPTNVHIVIDAVRTKFSRNGKINVDNIIKAYQQYCIDCTNGNEKEGFYNLVQAIVDNLNTKNKDGEVDSENAFIDEKGTCYVCVNDVFFFIREKMGEWLTTPDSEHSTMFYSWSFYGCDQLIHILSEYKPGVTTAEDVIPILDKALNVVHDRGDLAYLFFEGGIEELNKVSGISQEEYLERKLLRREDYRNKVTNKKIKNVTKLNY